MSSWDQRIRDHRVWGVMISLGRSIDEAAAIAALEPDMAAGIERARAALAFIGKRLAGADPMIALPSPLEDIAGALSRGEQHLANFSSVRMRRDQLGQRPNRCSNGGHRVRALFGHS